MKAVADAMFDPFEYFVLRDKDGLLRKRVQAPLGKVSYHIPCHSRVQNVGQKTREVLEWVPAPRSTPSSAAPGTTARRASRASSSRSRCGSASRCSGGWREADPDYISSDCPIAGRRIEQGIERAPARHRARKEHPLTLLRIAYGL